MRAKHADVGGSYQLYPKHAYSEMGGRLGNRPGAYKPASSGHAAQAQKQEILFCNRWKVRTGS